MVADFTGGLLSSDGGALLLRQVDSSLGITRSLAACFADRRVPELVVHSVRELLAQRINALALGYEDLNDHARLRLDPLLAAAAGKEDVLGVERTRSEHRGAALASPATLNRLELGAQHADYYRKLHADPQAVEAVLLKLGVRCLPRDSQVLVLDFDATDDPLHGRQEGRFLPAPSGAALRAKAPPFGCLAPLGSTATTTPTATFRCFVFVAMCACGHSCAHRIAMGAMAPWRRWKKSSPPSASGSRR